MFCLISETTKPQLVDNYTCGIIPFPLFREFLGRDQSSILKIRLAPACLDKKIKIEHNQELNIPAMVHVLVVAKPCPIFYENRCRPLFDTL
jgi:hypothetical protein